MRCHFKRTVIIRAGKEVEKLEGSCVADRIKNGSAAWKTAWQHFLKMLNTQLSHNLAILLLGVQP